MANDHSHHTPFSYVSNCQLFIPLCTQNFNHSYGIMYAILLNKVFLHIYGNQIVILTIVNPHLLFSANHIAIYTIYAN